MITLFTLFTLLLTLIHILAAAAWFGAMIYSLFVLHPKARRFFGGEPQRFEEFIASLAQGARWPVLAGIGLIAASGVAMWRLAGSRSQTWSILIWLKLALLLIATLIFSYTSWRLWPRRIFATAEEIARFQRTFRRIGWTLISIAAAGIVLGVIAHGQ